VARTAVRALAALAVLASLVLAPGAAGAQTASGVDGRQLWVQLFEGGGTRGGGRNTIEFVYTGDAAAVRNLQVSENGSPVTLDGPPGRLTRDRGVVFVIDSGKGMNQANLLPEVRDTILRVVRQYRTMPVEYAIVQAGDRADTRVDFTKDTTRIENALRSIGPTDGSAIWGGMNLAASMLGERTRLQPNVVLISADNDKNVTTSPVARSSVVANAVMLQQVLYTGEGTQLVDGESYELLAQATGAQLAPVSDREAFNTLLARNVEVIAERQYTASWPSAVPDGDPLHLEVGVADQGDRIDVLAGRGVYQGWAQLHPEIGAKQATIPLADNKVALALALLLALAGVAGVAYALTTALVQEDLSNVLQPYADAYGLIDGDTDNGGGGGGGGGSGLAKNALIQRAVALTEQVAENQGLLTRAEAALERANLPLRAGEALFGYVIVVLVLTFVPLILTRNILSGLLFGMLGAIIPTFTVSYIAKKRRKNFMGQLPDTLSLLSGTLKAGYSLMQGVEAVSQEVPEPMGLELRRVVTESRLGRPLEESLEASADRMDSPDFAWAVMAIRIQREVGGNLAELLLTVADTMIARERLRRDVAALTAEGRVSAYMLAGMPPILTAVMYVLNKEYVSTLFTDGLGIGMVVLAVFSMIVGFYWMKKIITIEI
jgi:tight adherence protein B